MLVALGFAMALTLAVMAARGIAAAVGVISGRFARLHYPESWRSLQMELDRTATLYHGYRQGAATQATAAALRRWARSRPHVLQIATETCDTLGTSSFFQLSNRHILRFDDPATLDPSDPWHDNDRPEMVMRGEQVHLVGARQLDGWVEADFEIAERTVTVRCSGAAILR